MRILSFANRNIKEILRDPINLFFGLAFPLILMLLLTAIQANIPVKLFDLQRLTPGITVFGLSFLSLFSATIIAKDRQSALLQRLYTTPMTPLDFILGYTLPLVPLAIVQCTVCYIAAAFLGLNVTVHIFYAVLLILPAAFLYIALGLLCGCMLNDKQAGAVCGALLTNLSAWLSGIWFDLDLVGSVFRKAAYALPFVHAVETERAALVGNWEGMLSHLWYVLGYAALFLTLAILTFLRQMKKQ